jgi:hypothetical protein
LIIENLKIPTPVVLIDSVVWSESLNNSLKLEFEIVAESSLPLRSIYSTMDIRNWMMGSTKVSGVSLRWLVLILSLEKATNRSTENGNASILLERVSNED